MAILWCPIFLTSLQNQYHWPHQNAGHGDQTLEQGNHSTYSNYVLLSLTWVPRSFNIMPLPTYDFSSSPGLNPLVFYRKGLFTKTTLYLKDDFNAPLEVNAFLYRLALIHVGYHIHHSSIQWVLNPVGLLIGFPLNDSQDIR